MDYDSITISDCINMFLYVNKEAVLHSGHVIGFEKKQFAEEENEEMD